MLICIIIPIPDYYGEGIFEKRLYFECSTTSPSIKDLHEFLIKKNLEEQQLAETNPEWGPFCFEYNECIQVLQNVNDIPVLNANSNIASSSITVRVNEKLGISSIVVKKIETFSYL